MKRIFFVFNRKEAYGMNQCKITTYDLIPTVLLLFALIFFKDPQQYNHPPIYGDHVPSVWIKCRYYVYSMSHHLKWLHVTTWLNSHVILQIGNPHYTFHLFHFHLFIYLPVTHIININRSYNQKWLGWLYI